MSETEEPIQVHIHGRYGKGPMPVEFRDALVELVKAVAEQYKDGEQDRRPAPADQEAGQ